MKIGILGGTFDPVHNGHLIVAEEAIDVIGLDQVIYVPARIPPHKIGFQITSESHRLSMLELALKSNQRFVHSDLEFHREGPSYTVETILEIGRRYPDSELYFIMGHDSFNELETWYKFEQLFDICRLIVVTRPGSPSVDPENFGHTIKLLLQRHTLVLNDPLDIPENVTDGGWKVCLLNIAGLRVSASSIRSRVRQGRTIRYLVPHDVRKYIANSNLYRQGGSGGAE